MAKMAWISYLCENKMRDELIKELNKIDISAYNWLNNKTTEEIADGFILAHENMRNKRNEDAYEKLNKIHNEMQRNTK